jgi:hypothetical protein
VALAALLTALPAAPAAAFPEEGSRIMTTETRTEGAGRALEAAVAAARDGNWQPLQDLQIEPAAIVAALAPLADAPDEDVRRDLALYLAGLDHPAASPLLARLLADPDADIRARAADALFALPDPGGALNAVPSATDALLADAAGGAPTAAQLLLLGYAGTEKAAAVLRPIVEDGEAPPVKLYPWQRPVPAALAATIALSRRGDDAARDALLQRQPPLPPEEMAFLLSVLPAIDSPAVLHHVAVLALDDEREIAGDVPSGAGPQRRLCDRAVDAFAARLDLGLPFALNPAGRYDEAQRRAVRDAMTGTVPQ